MSSIFINWSLYGKTVKGDFFFFFFFEIQLLYNVVLVSAVQQSESAVCVHMSPPS